MAGKHPSRAPVKHFGETLRASKYGNRLTREHYALVNKKPSTRSARETYSNERWAALAWRYEDDNHTALSEEYCTQQREEALENCDLNMAFFAKLSGREFLEALNGMLRRHQYLRPVTDLTTLDDEMGIYVMVLDRYKQAYIGQAGDIRDRIKRHWSRNLPFDRLLFPDKETSVLSIDCFRALDTTRIFAAKTIRGEELEQRLVNTFPPDLLLNRVPGGERIMGDRFLPSEIKRRALVPAKATESLE